MRNGPVLLWLFATACMQACSVTLTQQVAPSELDFTERSSFTEDGRLFVIGTRPDGRADAGSWLTEVVRVGDGHTTQNLVAGSLEGTVDGRIGSAPRGEPCVFTGMKARGTRIYAACLDGASYRSALLEVDVAASTVRAGYFTSCNAEPSSAPCQDVQILANGMGIDSAGRIYVTNSFAHVSLLGDTPSISIEGTGTITQIVIDSERSADGSLAFQHHTWFSADILQDGVGPNGIQIDGEVLYYAAGPNINRIDITASGEAGTASIHYIGPALSYIDDFAIVDGRMALARTIPPAIVALERPEPFGTARELGTYDMALDAIPSSITYQADNPVGRSVFPPDSLIVTCWFGGGIYSVTGVPR
jgi:hypothetical protein